MCSSLWRHQTVRMTVVVWEETTSSYSTKLTTIRCVELTGSVRKFHMPAASYRRTSGTANGICNNKKIIIFQVCTLVNCGPGSSVAIATELRAGRSGIESRWGRDFPPVQTGPGAHPASCKMGIGSFPGVKCGPGVLLITHPLLVPRSWKSRAIPLPTVWATSGL